MTRWWSLEKVDVRWNRVRDELVEIGLLDDGVYLDRIKMEVAWLPSLLGEVGYVFDDRVPLLGGLLGYREGVIYLPANTPDEPHVPGRTMTDVIRHEYGHAWAWIDRPFFRRPWFRRAFGRGYWDEWPMGESLWKLFGCDDGELKRSPYHQDFVTAYALSAPYEDLAETFMTFLRDRASLGRYSRRPGVYRKLLAVKDAVDVARKERAGLPRFRFDVTEA